MPTIPLIVNRQPAQGQQYPVPGPESFGAGVGRALTDAGQVFERIQAGADAAEKTKLVGEGSAGLQDALAEAKIKFEDPEQFHAAAKDAVQSVYDTTLDKASNPGVRRAVEAELANNKIQAETTAKFDYAQKKQQRAEGDLLVASDTLSRSAAEAPDDISRASIYRTFGATVGAMPLDSLKKQKVMLAFDHQVLTKQATRMILSDPAGFLVASDITNPDNPWMRLGEDKVLELHEKARKRIDQDMTRMDAIGRDITKRIEQNWYSDLANGRLDDARLREAFNNQNPWITPEKALQFQKLRDEGSSGGGRDQVLAVMSDYHRSSRSNPAISRTRKALDGLQSQVGPNKWIDAAFNELQTDESLLISQGTALEANNIARQNREIGDLQNNLEANRAILPGPLKSLLGNTEQQDKAKVKDIYKKQGKGAADDFVKSKTQETKQKVDSLPPQTKKVLELP